MTDNEDVTRINHNIKKLEKRAKELLAEGPENGAIDVLKREIFNQRRVAWMLEDAKSFKNHPVNMPVVLERICKRLGVGTSFI